MENLASFVCMVPILHIILFLIWVTEKVQDTILKSDQYVVSTDNVRGQISEHIFAAKLRLLCLLSVGFKNWGISSDIPQWNIRPRDAFRPIARE